MDLSLKNQKGFTIIEIIIAIFILSVSIIGVYSAFSAMKVLTSGSTDKLMASYLAQEGVEIVINIRDQNWINMSIIPNVNWDDGLAENTDCTHGCEVDYQTTGTALNPLRPWTSDGNYLRIDSSGFYGYSTINSTPTKFKRKITITTLNDHVLKVISEVFWDVKPNILNPLRTQESVKIEEVLYNWY
jgi:prepilin-type N-terminal cleavage/methylation domain-containing protein